MNVLVYLIPLALALGGLGLAAFLWSLQSGQYDDLEGPRTASCRTTRARPERRANRPARRARSGFLPEKMVGVAGFEPATPTSRT